MQLDNITKQLNNVQCYLGATCCPWSFLGLYPSHEVSRSIQIVRNIRENADQFLNKTAVLQWHISQGRSHIRDLFARLVRIQLVSFNCSGTSNDSFCAVVHLTGVPDRFGCCGCGVCPMPDGNGGVIVQLMSSTSSVVASGNVSGVTL